MSFYTKKKIQTVMFRYTVKQGGDLGIRVSNGSNRSVKIIFIGGELDSISHDLADFNLRSNWHVSGAIS